MDKENGKNSECNNASGTNKLSSNPTSSSNDPGSSLLDAANLFGAYWPRTDTSSSSQANSANLFAAAAAAASGFALPSHPSLPFGMLPPPPPPPPTSGRSTSGLPPPSYQAAAAAAAAAATSAAYSNAYTNTLSVAASQAASLGIPAAASAAWWSMASHLAAQDYLARLQASGLNFPSLGGSPTAADLQYAASLGLPSQLSSTAHQRSSKNSKNNSNSSTLTSSKSLNSKEKSQSSSVAAAAAKLEQSIKTNQLTSMSNNNNNTSNNNNITTNNNNKSTSSSKYSSLTIQSSNVKLSNILGGNSDNDIKKKVNNNDLNNYIKQLDNQTKLLNSVCNSGNKVSQQQSPTTLPQQTITSSTIGSTMSSTSNIFTNTLSLASSYDKNCVNSTLNSIDCNNSVVSGLPSSSILSDPNSILGGVRLPPDTEIIKYTSSIVGPKIPGTTNRGRKKTISLDPPSVSVHPSHSSTGMLIERNKRPKLNEQDSTINNGNSSDRVEVIKLPATNGSPSGISSFHNNNNNNNELLLCDTPLNLSLKPSTSNNVSSLSSLNSLSNMSANIGVDRISRRKPGPKPRRVLPPPIVQHLQQPPATLGQLFSLNNERPPSRNNDGNSDGGSSTSSTCTLSIPPTSSSTITTSTATSTISTLTSSSTTTNHKEGRPRNLGRGVSKPKKNTVASLLAQSRALGIKPMPILDPNVSMNQQMNILKSNILAAQQYISEAGGDEKALNKFLQEKFKGTLSDSSTVDASTDSDNNLTDSNHTDSELELEIANKKQKQFDERALRIPLEKGWKRETIIRGLTKNGGLKGDVTYVAPECTNKFKQMSDITQYLEYQKSTDLTKENFTFSCRVILGDYLQPIPPEMSHDGNEFIFLTEDDVIKRLDELKTAMRTNLPVEQRIEMARKQQAARAAARLDREHARLAKEIERSERQEAARRDREVRSQQLLEGRKRLAFTLEQKIQIISEIEGGKTKSDVSRELGLASSTVATIWKNRDNIINAYSSENLNHYSNNDNLFIPEHSMAKRKRQEEHEKHKQEEQQRKQQEREFKRQQAAILKEQMYIQEISKQREMLYTVELERERRRQHMALVKALENRRKLEEKERKKQQLLAEKQANKEKKLEQRKIEMEILAELRKPCEDLELDQKPLPNYERIIGLKLPGKAFADILMVFEFLHNFGETLGFDMESLPTLDSLQQALMPNEHSSEAEEELFSVMTHLLVCAIEDPGIPNPARHTTILGQSLRQADITHANLSEILRIYLYANATGEVKALTGVHFERDREKRIADHHQNDNEMQQTSVGKNSQYYELLHDNQTWKLSDMLKDKPFMALSSTDKAEILAFICNELLQNKAVIRQIENSLESVAQQKKEKWLLDTKIRKLRMLHSRKVRSEAVEKAQSHKTDLDSTETVDSPSIIHHKDDLLDEDENEMSENESVGTQPEEEEDNKLSGEELGKKLEKLIKTSELQLQTLNMSTHQLRATCYGQDRYWRRYWSLSKSGGIFVESMESAEPDVLLEQKQYDNEQQKSDINSLTELSNLIDNVENINDTNTDNEVSDIVGNSNNESEHRKTPNRIIYENGEILDDKNERNLAQLRQSVDDIVENINKEKNEEKSINSHLEDESITNKKFNLFEKLGQCMERENKTEQDLKADVKQEIKEELKNEILNELKTTEIVKNENEEKQSETTTETKWFSLLQKEPTCEGVYLTTGIGTSCTRDNLTELKIPVFPPPSQQQQSNSHSLCDSPAPLQMTPEESLQLEHIKKHGMPKSCPRKQIPLDKRYGWWRLHSVEMLKEILDNLHVRGVRERELKRNFINIMQTMYEIKGKLHIENGQKELIDLCDGDMEKVKMIEGGDGAPQPDDVDFWSQAIAHRVDLFLLEQVEALEDKVASASMQIKGWKIPNRDGSEIPVNKVVPIVRERLSSLEQNIERRYLKPPLGLKPTCINISNTSDQNTSNTTTATTTTTAAAAAVAAAAAQEISANNTSNPNSTSSICDHTNEIPKGLAVWREAVNRAQTSAQLAMCLYSLESSIAWDKSIMKANCQFCHSGDNEDKLLLCDGCDKGYHTYCFKPKMDNIPDGDWYCHECMNKATGERNCIVCGKKCSVSGTRLILCELCPRAYHTDCIQPILHKVPRGKWYCSKCISKKPQKKIRRFTHNKSAKDELSDQPPASPAPSHSSVTTNEDQQTTNCNQNNSDMSNCSLGNTNSPSTMQNTPSLSSSSSTSSASSNVSSAATATTTTTTTNVTTTGTVVKKDRISKKLMKELAPCKIILEDLECHDDAWPFLLPVNTKQFPTYKKIIKIPMDLSTIKKKLYECSYKSKEEFCLDVRQIFNNCEVFNEDDSPVGKAGHCMRQFFEARWNELCLSNS